MNFRLVASAIGSLAGIFAAAACSPGASASGTGSSGAMDAPDAAPAVSASACIDRCKAKLASCQTAPEIAEQACAKACAGAVTEVQLTCFEAKDCGALAPVIEELCPSGGPGPSSGGPGTSSGTPGASSGTPGASSGMPGADGLPTIVTITGAIPERTAATHRSDADRILSGVAFELKPTINPLSNVLPDIADPSVRGVVNAPAVGSCQPIIGYTLSATQLAVYVTGQDVGGLSDCATLVDRAVSNGFKATLSNVPYRNSATKATVTIELTSAAPGGAPPQPPPGERPGAR